MAKQVKRPDTPLAETPKMDAMELANKLKSIQEESNKRRAEAYAKGKAIHDKRRASMSSKGKQAGDGGKLQGLNTSLGSKIITK